MTITSPSASRLDTLRARIAGDLITPGSIEYDTARQVQDFTVDARPLALVRVANDADVAEAVSFARRNALPLVVRSGGHSLARYGMVDDALVVDMSAMKRIEIDPATRIAHVQTGVTSGEFGARAAVHGLALTTGDTASVGFGGLTTGGGIGFMVRKHGLTIDSLRSARVVTAAGDIVTASEREHADLFWAIRGGGGNFGVVTELELELAEVPQILGGDLLLPATREVLRGYLEYSVNAPEGLSTIANIMHAPPAPFVPEAAVGQPVIGIIVCWTGDLAEGERAIAPLRALGTPVADTVRPMPYKDIYLSTQHQELRHGFTMRSMFADALSDEALDAMLAANERATTPYSIVHLRGLGGAMARVGREATAFAHRDARYLFATIAVWLDQQDDPAPHQAWTEELWQQVRHEGRGVYVNFLQQEGDARIRDAYPPATHARLAEVKRRYDPDNLFRFNQNVQPAR